MLFPRNALAPGPQACFLSEKRIAKVKVGKAKIPLDTQFPFFVYLTHHKSTSYQILIKQHFFS
jgi:hypothetical protein